MRRLTRLALCSAVAASLTGSLLAVQAQAAPEAGLQADFNGDGYADLAVGDPYAEVGSHMAGAVVVLYGSAQGPSAAKRTVIHQNSAGVPGTAEEGDRFGSGVATGDLDGDGYADLVVGSDGEAIGEYARAGSITVVWGGPQGLKGGAVLPQPTLSAQRDFGRDVATGDFDGDGHLDVTANGNHTEAFYGPFTRSGTPVRRQWEIEGSSWDAVGGDLDGDGAAERLYLTRTDKDLRGLVRYYRWKSTGSVITELPRADGDQGAVADVDGDGYGDLVMGEPDEPSKQVPGGHLGGQVTVWYGGPNGPDPLQEPTVIHQDTTGVPGGAEHSDWFGSSVAAGDVNGDGYADVAVGAPGEDLGSDSEAGMVTVLYGSTSGLRGTGAQAFHQDTAGVPGTAEDYDYFGQTLSLTDATGDGRADLVAAAPAENQYGAVWFLRGTSSGVTVSGSTSISARGVGLTGYSTFGRTLATAAEDPGTR